MKKERDGASTRMQGTCGGRGGGGTSFDAGRKFRSCSLVVHSDVGGSGAAETRMNGLRDDPLTTRGSGARPVGGANRIDD